MSVEIVAWTWCLDRWSCWDGRVLGRMEDVSRLTIAVLLFGTTDFRKLLRLFIEGEDEYFA
jgi:hypothetical protein